MRDPLGQGVIPQDAPVLDEWIAVVEHQRGAGRLAGHQPVLHQGVSEFLCKRV